MLKKNRQFGPGGRPLALFVCLFFSSSCIYLSNLALGSLGEATGEPVGRGEEQDESWVPSLRN